MKNNKRYISILESIKNNGGNLEDGTKNDKVLIIDGLNTFIRVFSVMPTTNEDGIHVGGIVGFLRSIGYSIKTLNPTRTIIVFDGKGGSNRRRSYYSNYKENRKTRTRLNRVHSFDNIEDERKNMMMQFSRCIEYLEHLPLTILSIDGIEADDTIGYIAKQVLKDSKIDIMSTDKDFLQLVDDRIKVWSPTKKKRYDVENFEEEYGIRPNNYLLLRMFEGDRSDNISGVKGIGKKTLLKNFPWLTDGNQYTLEDVMKVATAKEKENKNFYGKIIESKDTLFLNRRLMQLNDVDIPNSDKLKIMSKVDEKIPNLAKIKFQQMFLEDRMFNTLPNLDSWLLSTFNQLNKYSKKD